MKKWVLTLCGVASVFRASAEINIVDDFSTDPMAGNRWNFGIGSNVNNQFAWNNTAPAYAGDSSGSVALHLNSTQPTARLQRPLGATLTDTTDFHLTVQFAMIVTSAPADQSFQLAFGLVNSSTTGGDRTGSVNNFTSDNVFDTVELNYFPNVTTFGGPTLTTTVFGARKNGGDAFANFASLFGVDSDLGSNTTGIKELPPAVTLQSTLSYDGDTKLLTLIIEQINPDGSLTVLNTEVPPLDLANPGGFSNYDEAFSFAVDSLAIMAYQDNFTSPASPSLIADMTFQRVQLSSPVPEPNSVVLWLIGTAYLTAASKRRPRRAPPSAFPNPDSAFRIPRSAFRSAFTVVELLAVVACLAILSSLLAAALGHTRGIMDKATCANNLRQLAAASNLYLADHEQTFFPYAVSLAEGKLWYFGLEKSAGGKGNEGERKLDLTKGALAPYLGHLDRAGICPAFPYQSPQWKPKFTGASYTYGFNLLLSQQKMVAVRDLSQVVLFGDCAQVNTFQAPASPDHPLLEEFYMIEQNFKTIHFRHGDLAQFVFVDGHLEGMKADPETLDLRLPEANIGRVTPVGSIKYLQ